MLVYMQSTKTSLPPPPQKKKYERPVDKRDCGLFLKRWKTLWQTFLLKSRRKTFPSVLWKATNCKYIRQRVNLCAEKRRRTYQILLEMEKTWTKVQQPSGRVHPISMPMTGQVNIACTGNWRRTWFVLTGCSSWAFSSQWKNRWRSGVLLCRSWATRKRQNRDENMTRALKT